MHDLIYELREKVHMSVMLGDIIIESTDSWKNDRVVANIVKNRHEVIKEIDSLIDQLSKKINDCE